MDINNPATKQKAWIASVSVTIGIGIGAAIGVAGASGGHTTTTVPGPTVTQTVPAPGPTVTQTQQVQAPPPPAGTVLHVFKNSGNQVTPAFNVPDSGNYIVKWSYSGNSDSYGPTNFAISNTGDGLSMSLPNDIAASGSGSTEITGATGTDSLNVQALGSWTITIVSAS